MGRWVLVVGDLLTLLVFAYMGQLKHEMVNEARPLLGLLWTELPFVVAWLAAGRWLGAFMDRGEEARPFLGRSLNTWLVAAPLGVLLRSYLLGRTVIPTVFVTAALGFGGAMILGWRVLFMLVLLPRLAPGRSETQ
jgi:hypothetical protein